MARIQPDGTVVLQDGKRLDAQDYVEVADLAELTVLLVPPAPPQTAMIPAGVGFSAGGGRQGVQGPPGPVGPAGPAGPGNGWQDDGTVVRLTTATDQVVVGAAVPFGAEKLLVVGTERIEGDLLLSGASPFWESTNGSLAPVSGAATGRIRYNNFTGTWQSSTQGGVYADFATSANAFVQGGNSFGATAVFGTNDLNALELEVAGTPFYRVAVPSGNFVWLADTDMLPSADFMGQFGSPSLRFFSASMIRYDVYGAAGDAETVARLSGAGLQFGAGGASAMDIRLYRTGALAAEIDDGAGGDITFTVRGKLTVTGAIDPTSVLLSGSTALFFESNDGSTAPVSGAATGRIRYNNFTGTWQGSTQGGAYTDFGTGGGGGGWQDDGTIVRLVATTDSVNIGGTLDLGKLTVQGDADEVQLRVRGNAAQTSNLVQFETSAPGTVWSLTNAGATNQTGSFSISGTSVFEADRDLAVNLVPNATATLTLGTASAEFLDAFLSGSLRLRESAGDPAAVADTGFVYTKDVAGITQLFYRASDGTVNQVTPAAGGGGGWTDAGTLVHLSTASDNVTVGSATDIGKLGVIGDTDEFQLRVRGNAVQTSSLVQFENSAAVSQWSLTNVGNTNQSGSFAIGATTVFESDRDFAIDLVPSVDNNFFIGSNTRRIASVSVTGTAGILGYFTYSGAGDANARVMIDVALRFGPGGATAVDTEVGRGAANRFDVFSGDSLNIVSGTFQMAAVTLFEADRDLAVTLLPNADNTLDLGSSTRRFNMAFSTQYLVHAASGDANASAALTSNSLQLGAGGATALDVQLTRGAADRLDLASGDSLNIVLGSFQIAATTVFESDRDVAINLVPNADGTLEVGSTTRQWNGMHSREYSVRATAGDANPTSRLASGDLRFGPGGAVALDVRLFRSAVDELSLASGDSLFVEGSYIQMAEIAAPAAPTANRGRIYMEDNGAGKTRLVVVFSTGAAQIIATEP